MLAFLWVAVKTIIAIVFVLVSIALVHEFGHYITAKMCGVWVLEFAIGFGNRLWKKRLGETLYSFRPLPLGGFVRLAGMDNIEDKPEVKEGEELTEEQKAELAKKVAEDDDPDLPKVPIDHPKSYVSRPWWAKVIVLGAGAFMNLVWAAVLLASIYIFVGGPISNIQILEAPVDNVAYKAGIRSGDIITRIDGVKLTDWSQGMAMINNNPGKEISLEVVRSHPINKSAAGGGVMRDDYAENDIAYQTHDEEILTFKVIPVGEMGSAKIGIGLAPNNYDFTKLPLGTAIVRGCQDTISMIVQTIDGLYRMVVGQTKGDLAGPVKIMKMIKDQSSKGLADLFYLTALLSVNIGLLNILPFPVLDGGRIVFVLLDAFFGLINKIFKTKLVVNSNVEETIHFIGMIILILLMVYVTFKDVISFL